MFERRQEGRLTAARVVFGAEPKDYTVYEHFLRGWRSLRFSCLLYTSPVPKEARDIVHSLYLLQDQFDCGYTLLRTQQELEKLNYLFMLPPENLPEPERGEAMALRGEGGFFGKSSRCV